MPPRRHPLQLPPIPYLPDHRTPLSLILACGWWRCSSRGRKRGNEGCLAAICICPNRYAWEVGLEGGGRRQTPSAVSALWALRGPHGLKCHAPATTRVNTGPARPKNPHLSIPPTNSPFPYSPSPPTHADEQTLASERARSRETSQPWRCVPCTTRSGA